MLARMDTQVNTSHTTKHSYIYLFSSNDTLLSTFTIASPSNPPSCSHLHPGRDCSMPPGGFNFPNPIPQARATMFANLDGSDGQLVDTTCFGTNYPVTRDYLPAGVTGVVAVNPTLYGSRCDILPFFPLPSPLLLSFHH